MGSTQKSPPGFAKMTLDDLLPSTAPTAFPILLQPSPRGLDLFDTCSTLLFTWLLF